MKTTVKSFSLSKSKMEKIIIIACVIAAITALTPPPITGETPPAIDCPDKLCNGKADGNFPIGYQPNHFVQCLDGHASCQACWPKHLVFSGKCNQCLYKKDDECVTTVEWQPATTFECPDDCPKRGPAHTGNIVDAYQSRQYIACWKGVTLGCVACPGHLEFSEKENACLYEGKFITEPTKE